MKPTRFDAAVMRDGFVVVRLELMCRRESREDLAMVEELQGAIANGADVEIQTRRTRPYRSFDQVEVMLDGVNMVPIEFSIDAPGGTFSNVLERKPKPEPPTPSPDVWLDPSK